jgi:hypothetical protein
MQAQSVAPSSADAPLDPNRTVGKRAGSRPLKPELKPQGTLLATVGAPGMAVAVRDGAKRERGGIEDYSGAPWQGDPDQRRSNGEE